MFKFFSPSRSATILPLLEAPTRYCCDIQETLMVLPATDQTILPGPSDKHRSYNAYYYDWSTIRLALESNPECPFRVQHVYTGQVGRNISQYQIDVDLLQEIVTWVTEHLSDSKYVEEINVYAQYLFKNFCNLDSPLGPLNVIFQEFSHKDKCTLFNRALSNQSLFNQQNTWIQWCCAAIQRHQTDWLVFAIQFLNQNSTLKKSFIAVTPQGKQRYEYNDNEGRSLLMRAAIAGNLEACHVLSQLKQDINQIYKKNESSSGETALTYAVMSNKPKILGWLLAQNAALFLVGQAIGQTSIYCRALTQDNIPLLKYLLDQPGIPPLRAVRYALNFCVSQKFYEGFPLLLEKLLKYPQVEIRYNCFSQPQVTYLMSGLELMDLDHRKTTLLMRLAKTGNTSLFLTLIESAKANQLPLGFMHSQIISQEGIIENKNVIHEVIQSMDLVCLKAVYAAAGTSNQPIFLNMRGLYGSREYLALDLAVKLNKADMVQWLLQQEAALSFFSETCELSTLDIALQSASEDIVKYLLAYLKAKNIPIDDKVVGNQTLAILLDDTKKSSKLNLLLDAGLLLTEVIHWIKKREDNQRERIAIPLLLAAVRKQPWAIIEKILSYPHLAIEEDVIRSYGQLYRECNPLYLAAKYNVDVTVSEMLYKRSLFLQMEPESDQTTYFSWWVMRGRSKLAQVFLSDYLDSLEYSNEGPQLDDWIDFHYVAYQGLVSELEALYTERSDALNQRVGFHLTPLVLAIAGERPDNAKFLIDNGADLTAKDYNQATCLHWCAKVNDVTTLNYLAEQCDRSSLNTLLESKNIYGYTPLAVAYFARRESVFIELLNLGADVTSVCHENKNLLTLLIEAGDTEYASLTLEHCDLLYADYQRLEEMLMFKDFFNRLDNSYKTHQAQLSAEVVSRYQRLVLAISHVLYHKSQYLADPSTLLQQTHLNIEGQDVVIHFEVNVSGGRHNLSIEAYLDYVFVTLKTHYELFVAYRDELAWFNNLPEGLCIDARINTLASEIETLRAHAIPKVDELIQEAWLAHESQEEESEEEKHQQVISDVLARYFDREVIFSDQTEREEVVLLTNNAVIQARLQARLLSFVN